MAYAYFFFLAVVLKIFFILILCFKKYYSKINFISVIVSLLNIYVLTYVVQVVLRIGDKKNSFVNAFDIDTLETIFGLLGGSLVFSIVLFVSHLSLFFLLAFFVFKFTFKKCVFLPKTTFFLCLVVLALLTGVMFGWGGVDFSYFF